jgi:hypothetical protein
VGVSGTISSRRAGVGSSDDEAGPGTRRLGATRFARANLNRGSRLRGLDLRGTDDRGGRDDGPGRGVRGRDQLGHDGLCLEPGPVEEAREDLGAVFLGEHLCERGHRGQAEPAVSEGLDDLGEALDELRSGLAEERSSLGEPELPVEEGEEAGVPERHPPAPAIELREREQEVGHGVVLLAEQGGEAGGEGSAVGGVHAGIMARPISRTVRCAGCPARALRREGGRFFLAAHRRFATWHWRVLGARPETLWEASAARGARRSSTKH